MPVFGQSDGRYKSSASDFKRFRSRLRIKLAAGCFKKCEKVDIFAEIKKVLEKCSKKLYNKVTRPQADCMADLTGISGLKLPDALTCRISEEYNYTHRKLKRFTGS